MSGKPKTTRDPYKRHKTRYPGITYREKDDGSRTYYVTVGSRHLRVDGGEQEALLVQADLRTKTARGLRVTPLPITLGQVAQAWFERGCVRWRRSTQRGYKVSLDTHLLPIFGDLPIASISTDMVAAFIADRRAAGAEESYIALNLRPLNGAFKLAHGQQRHRLLVRSRRQRQPPWRRQPNLTSRVVLCQSSAGPAEELKVKRWCGRSSVLPLERSPSDSHEVTRAPKDPLHRQAL